MTRILAGRPAKVAERVLLGGERPQPDRLAVPHRPHVDDLSLDRRAAGRAAPALMSHDEDVIVALDELDGLDLVLVEHLDHRREGLARALDPLVALRVRYLLAVERLEIGREVAQNGIEVSAVEGLVTLAQLRDV